MLEDGTYDVMVVDAAPTVDADGVADGGVRLDLTVIAGAHKGEVVTLGARGLHRDPLDLLGVPGTVVVADGNPRLRLEG